MSNKKQNQQWENCIFIISFFVIIFLFKSFIMDKVVVNGTSMVPTYYENDVLWVKTFGEPQPERFDVVVARVGHKKVLKRVVGLPGENLKIVNGYVYVNGVRLENDIDIQMENVGIAQEEIKIGENAYFLLGDNRNASEDSREWGAVSQKQIVGNVIMKIYPWYQLGEKANWVGLLYYFMLVAIDLVVYMVIIVCQKRKYRIAMCIGYFVLISINAVFA